MGIHYKVFGSFLHHWGHFQLPFHSVGLQQCLCSSAFGALAAAPSLLPPSASIYLLVPDISGPGNAITVQTRNKLCSTEDPSFPQQQLPVQVQGILMKYKSVNKVCTHHWLSGVTHCSKSHCWAPARDKLHLSNSAALNCLSSPTWSLSAYGPVQHRNALHWAWWYFWVPSGLPPRAGSRRWSAKG